VLNQKLIDDVQRWISQDPDPRTVAQLQKLLEEAQADPVSAQVLADSFSGSLQFGTAGLRGALGPGPNRMNRITVLRAAAGLGNYLIGAGFVNQLVVIGFDARHNSAQFAQDTAEVLAGVGFRVAIFGDVVPTPVLAFTILDQQACAGVMVTASHNPASDNGYKVYLGDGRQIIAPIDTDISQHIAQVSDVGLLARSHDIVTLGQDALTRYVETTAQIVSTGPIPRDEIEAVRYVYTAMHGVGYRTFAYVMSHAGFGAPDCVVEQQHPDPDFPTTAFPNPEEEGSLDLAIALATSTQSQIIIANDPDADRLAVAIPDESGVWQQLCGDDVGALLGWWMIERARRMETPIVGTFANSLVSSTLLKQIAQSARLQFEQTLTGFKWVSRVPELRFGYEEALGYCVDPEHVRDKDGISAAMLILEMFAALHADGKTFFSVLDELSRKFGLYKTSQLSIRVSQVSEIESTMDHLRHSPPEWLGAFEITNVIDLALGSHLPVTDGLIFILKSMNRFTSARVIVRPSGTEPKIKCYIEIVIDRQIQHAKSVADQVMSEIKNAMQPLLESHR